MTAPRKSAEAKPTANLSRVREAESKVGDHLEAQRQERIARRRGLTADQYETLMRPLNATRVAKRSQGGKQLSYLEAWDVKAHLIRIFGFANFDSETLDEEYLGTRDYKSDNGKDMVEVIWRARHRLVVRDQHGTELARYAEGAVGSASGPATMLGEHHDNALKTAASDALKRCAINLGTQFGLSLYDNGSTKEVVRGTRVVPEGYDPAPKTTEEARQVLAERLGAQEQKQEQPT